jgi:hypothetical protein
VVANLAWLGLTLSRKYLAALARAAQWVTASFSRHMELDADRHEAAIVGAAVFEETTLRLPQLRTASNIAWRHVNEGWAMRRMPDDLPRMFAAVEQILSDETIAQVRAEAMERKTGRWDTHPSNSERIEAVRAFNAPSLFKLEGEAGLLFADLPSLTHQATVYHYERIAKLDCRNVRFATIEDSVAWLQAKSAGTAAVSGLFHCSPEFVAEWLTFPARDPIAGEYIDVECTLAGSTEEPVYRNLADKARLHFCARTIRDAGVNVKTESFRLRDGDVEAVRIAQMASAGELAGKNARSIARRRRRFPRWKGPPGSFGITPPRSLFSKAARSSVAKYAIFGGWPVLSRIPLTISDVCDGLAQRKR